MLKYYLDELLASNGAENIVVTDVLLILENYCMKMRNGR
jgi:hypothetical protein